MSRREGVGGSLAALLVVALSAAPARAQGTGSAGAAREGAAVAVEGSVAGSGVEPTAAGYAAALGAIASALDRGEWETARDAGRRLDGLRFAGEDGSVFESDPVLLAAIGAVKDAPTAVRARARVGRVLESLGRRDAVQAVAAVDAEALARLSREEAARRPKEGGEVDASVPVRRPSVPEQIREWLSAAWDWAAKWMRRIWDWLTRRSSAPGEPARDGTTATFVTILVALIVAGLAVALVRSLRRRDEAEASGEAPEATASARDENPLSREAGEWERYAAELASAGRRREAVRAWYHAVLVSLFRSGRLHHQKGRTNWEYVSQLAPDLAWQPRFVDLTQTFDREWYGREASTAEALRECAARAREVLSAVRAEEGA